MFKTTYLTIATAAALALAPLAAKAQDAGALLDLLVKKKIITDQEAEEVRSELTKQTAETSAGKWKMSVPLTELELYGDVRTRFEYRGGRTASNVPTAAPGVGVAGARDWQERDRFRYRLRLGLRGTLADDWFFGLRLETNTNPRSANITFGDDSQVNGPFSKDSDRINVSQAYIGYKGFRDITLTVGKMQNPLVSTSMVWDPDINPEGFAEQWKHTYNFNFGGGSTVAASGYSKDGKSVASSIATASEPWKLKLDLFANFGQFIYDDANPENPLGARPSVGGRLVPNSDAFLLAWQLGARVTFPKNIYAQIAPTLYNYTGNGDNFNARFLGGSPFVTNAASLAQNQVGLNSLMVYDMPWEIGWKVGELPMKLFGDFAVNIDGDDRAIAAGRPDKQDQKYAYQVGISAGQLKAKRDWQVDVFWQHTEQYSLDPNLVDSDLYDSRVNMEGIAVRAGYMLSDAVGVNLLWAYGRASDHSLGTGGAGDIGINPLSRYQLLQADLQVKF